MCRVQGLFRPFVASALNIHYHVLPTRPYVYFCQISDFYLRSSVSHFHGLFHYKEFRGLGEVAYFLPWCFISYFKCCFRNQSSYIFVCYIFVCSLDLCRYFLLVQKHHICSQGPYIPVFTLTTSRLPCFLEVNFALVLRLRAILTLTYNHYTLSCLLLLCPAMPGSPHNTKSISFFVFQLGLFHNYLLFLCFQKKVLIMQCCFRSRNSTNISPLLFL